MTSFDYHAFIAKLWFERRDIVSDGFDAALNAIRDILPDMAVHTYASGTPAWTWTIPDKWSVQRAYIKDGDRTLLDIKDHPLHVMSYSAPVSGRVSKAELLQHLHTRPDAPDSIPFEFSYYQKKWGFCIQHNRLPLFSADSYDILIESKFEPGALKVGAFYLPGRTKKEIVLIAHLCHPCMVDDDLSGVAVLVATAFTMRQRANRYYSYRFLILPETIGSIAYLSHNEELIANMQFGIFLEMLGHDDLFSLQKSRQADTTLDRAAEICLRDQTKEFRIGGFHEIVGNDEKVFNGPGVNVPTISLSRAKPYSLGKWPYPEYHTSADTPEIVTAERLNEAESIVARILDMLDTNYRPVARFKGPLFLSRYEGLWVDWRTNRELNIKQRNLFDYLHTSDKTLIDIAYELGLPFDLLTKWMDIFSQNKLIERIMP